ncbi:MAG: hypothetical protein A2163_07995 [Actinobacteria bacterium RBG_13_35_12]|nr:MAG: hypothetical protein A2163_07995 [Actinobacteria bacterium RBG_13_35_12]
MKKGTLKKLVDSKFEGKYWLASNEMVRLFVEKYNISGSVASYDFYPKVQRLWGKILKEEATYWGKEAKLWKEQEKMWRQNDLHPA